MRQLAHVESDAIGAFFDDWNRLVVLACDRTETCPGVKGGVLRLDKF